MVVCVLYTAHNYYSIRNYRLDTLFQDRHLLTGRLHDRHSGQSQRTLHQSYHDTHIYVLELTVLYGHLLIIIQVCVSATKYDAVLLM